MAMSNDKSDSMRSSSTKLASFAHVNFCNVPECYTSGADVECLYVIGKELEISSRDWVGLYKVGWRSSSDYVCYGWSPIPPNYAAGKEFTNRVTFPGSKLPKDDGEFYQFCYVSGSGQVRGASTPFQFKHPMTDDFIEIEDENGELLVIRSKTAVLEDQLKKANEIRMEQKQKIAILENERALVSFSMRELEKKLADQKNECEVLQCRLRENVEKNADLQQEIKDLQVCVRCLQEKMDILNQEKLTMEKRLDDSDVYIVSLQEKIKNLVTEKDVLVGARKSLEEENEQYQRRAESSDKQHQMALDECEKLSHKLNVSESSREAMREEIAVLRSDLEEQNRKVQRHMQLSSEAKEELADLTESLRNAEDKLEAAEMCKKMLNDEVLTLRQAFEKMSLDLEMSKAEAESSKRHHDQLVSRASSEKVKLQEMEEVTSKLSEKENEIKALVNTIAELRCEISELSQRRKTDEDAMFVLQTAQATLKERYAKLTRRNEDLAKHYNQTVQTIQQMEEKDVEQKQEIASLKQRLMIGQEAYKEVFVQRQLLQAEVDRLAPGKSLRSWERTVGNESELTTNELSQQMAEIRREMEKRGERVSKYRRLYYEMKKKFEAASAELHEHRRLQESSQQLSYPGSASTRHHQRQISPQLSSSSREASPDHETLRNFDPLADAADSPSILTVPLKPLPPPMQPEILPSAKVASVKASLGYSPVKLDIVKVKMPGGGESTLEIPCDFDPNLMFEEEKFVDAPSEPFGPTTTSDNKAGEDIPQPLAGEENWGVDMSEQPWSSPAADVGYVCPVCNGEFNKTIGVDVFTQHVNMHFE
jgi:predicted  nucleic acid-binding Zn-ribbon protein